MKTAEKSTKAMPEAAAATANIYAVLSKLIWHGKIYEPGSKVTFAKQGSHANRDRWLKAKRIRSLTAKEAAAVVAAMASTSTAKKAKAAPAERDKPLPEMVGKFELIAHDRIDRSPFNPRKDFSSEGAKVYLTGLAQSIRERGIIEPLIIRPVGTSGRYELVAGECRWRAAKEADISELPCIVRPYDKLGAILAQAVENLQRRDINPMEEAEGYSMLMREGKYTVQDIVRETGKSEASVYARLKLLECPPGIRKAVEENRLPATTAELVARVPQEHRTKAMDAILFPESSQPTGEDPGGVLSFRQAKAWVEQNAPKFTAEQKWEKTVKGHHLFSVAARTVGPSESDALIFSGGWVRDRAYVRPFDTCYEDPERRNWDKLAGAVGKELPAPLLVCDPGDFTKVVVLYPKKAALEAMGDAIPDPEEFKRREDALKQQLDQERKGAEERRELEALAWRTNVGAAADAVTGNAWDEDRERSFLMRLLFHRINDELCNGYGNRFAEIVTRRGGDGQAAEDWENPQIRALVSSCTVPELRGWLLELSFTEQTDDPAGWLDEPMRGAAGNEGTADVCGSGEDAEAPGEAAAA